MHSRRVYVSRLRKSHLFENQRMILDLSRIDDLSKSLRFLRIKFSLNHNSLHNSVMSCNYIIRNTSLKLLPVNEFIFLSRLSSSLCFAKLNDNLAIIQGMCEQLISHPRRDIPHLFAPRSMGDSSRRTASPSSILKRSSNGFHVVPPAR